jgi:hypothetical protein
VWTTGAPDGSVMVQLIAVGSAGTPELLRNVLDSSAMSFTES